MASAEVQQNIALAMQHLRENRPTEAEAVIRGVLAQDPANDRAMAAMARVALVTGRAEAAVELLRAASTLNPQAVDHTANLAMVLSNVGRIDEAIEVFRVLLASRPDLVEAWNNLGLALKAKGRLADAEESFRRALSSRPDFPDAMSNLGVVLREQGKLEESVEWLTRAAAAGPTGARTYINLGKVLAEKGRWEDAERAFRNALGRESANADALFGLAGSLHRQGKLTEAVDAYRAALRASPGSAEAHYNLGKAFQELKDAENAAAAFRSTLELRPDAIDAATNLAAVLRESNRPAEAEQVMRTAIRTTSGNALAWNALGGALADQDRLTEAAEAFAKALSIDPQNHEAKWNRGAALLTLGRLAEGWGGYEARREVAQVTRTGEFNGPRWGGEELAGRTILLHAEQGFGDTIQFARYIPLVRRRGGRVMVLCPRALNRLFLKQLGIEAVVSGGEAMPQYDVHCPFPSLPGVFKTTLTTIPTREGYLLADAKVRERWRQRLAGEPGRLKVGLAWAGNPQHSNDAYRSTALWQLRPLAEAGDLTFVSLQKGDAAVQSLNPPAGMRLLDWTNDLTDFAETAGLIANLDLVISVDTAVVHLAGALGKPVWVLLPGRGDWRWMRRREDSPWYASARLFRQKDPGQWQPVVEKVAVELKTFRA